MSQNLVSLLITKEQQAALIALLVQFLQILQGLIDLEPDQRARLITKGAGSDRFVRIVILALQQNPDIVPRNLDVTEAQADLDALEMLEPIATMLRQVLSRVEDTQMALGSDLMVFANKGYALMQANGSAAGMEDALNEASYRYAKKRSQGEARERRRQQQVIVQDETRPSCDASLSDFLSARRTSRLTQELVPPCSCRNVEATRKSPASGGDQYKTPRGGIRPPFNCTGYHLPTSCVAPAAQVLQRREDVMSEAFDAPTRREPTVFVAHEEAHFELCKLRAYLRLLIQIVDPESIGLKATTLHPQAFSWLLTNIWKGVDEYLQATYWSADHAIDIEEAHTRIAAIRERNEELRGIAAI